MSIYSPREDGLYGMLAEFRNPGELVHAAEAVHKAGYRRFDTHSPFPIHGMDKAMGLGNSLVGAWSLGGGLTGLAAGYLLQWWTGAVDYPMDISGKPAFAVEPSVPVMFELTILFAALGAVIGMFAMNGLPRPYNPLFNSERFASVTDDGFFLHVAASDKNFDVASTDELLRKIGALSVEKLYDLDDTAE
ncbi:MAG: DUF3341 domain-containing protein [Bacteroidetes bacterium]|nr:DUF3341 domain-containing protein [Bacteroidota bacterium]